MKTIIKFFKQIFIVKEKVVMNCNWMIESDTEVEKISDFQIILINFIGWSIIGGFACLITDGLTWFPTSFIIGGIWAFLWLIACFVNFYKSEKHETIQNC